MPNFSINIALSCWIIKSSAKLFSDAEILQINLVGWQVVLTRYVDNIGFEISTVAN